MDQNFDLRSLPRPTDEQFEAFAEHVGEAHSWYKHLDLLTGRPFVVFLAPDSGVGRLVAQRNESGFEIVEPPEGPVFTEEHPRLHYSWKTSEEYRRRFGYLDFASQGYDGTFGRDVGDPMCLPQEIMDRCSFTLFPYVSADRWDSVRWAHGKAIASLRAGTPHPKRDTVLEWRRLVEERDQAWESLTDAERDSVLARDREGAQSEAPTAAVTRYLGLEAELEAVYSEQLRPGELAKIRHGLSQLKAWLDGR